MPGTPGVSFALGARRLVLLATFTVGLTTACGPKQIAGPSRPGASTIVLLPDAPRGTVGRAGVSNAAGSTDLDAAGEATTVSANEAPSPARTMSDRDVRRLFGEALSALPPALEHYALNLRFESDELTEQSQALVPEILKTVKARVAPDVVVIGHTDTTGASEANFKLGLKRAMMVRALLVRAGLDAGLVEVVSHGEGNLLVQTPDDTPEPRNRRVEIAVR
jgi:outer membrane protein OmpA-like peptidoglycan-associated protein